MRLQVEDEDENHAIKSCIVWIPRGVPRKNPLYASNINEIDLNANVTEDRKFAKDKNKNKKNIVKGASNDDEFLYNDLDMDNYDNESNENVPGANLFNINEKELEEVNNKDEYLNSDAYSDSSGFDDEIKPNEFAIAVGNIENEDYCEIETYLYNPDEYDCSLHHATMIKAYPLALEYCPIVKDNINANYIAVATFLPFIEIYNNDIIDQLEPEFILDNPTNSHQAAITCIKAKENLLLSVSQDGSAIVWNMNNLSILKHYENLCDKKLVSCTWLNNENIFITHSDNKELIIVNTTNDKIEYLELEEYIESMALLPADNNTVALGTTEGNIIYYNFISRTVTSKKTIDDSNINCIEFIKNTKLLTIGLESGDCLIYDTEKGVEIIRKVINKGPIYNITANPEIPTIIAIATNVLIVWDISNEDEIKPYLI